MSMSDAVNFFLYRVAKTQSFPPELKVPNEGTKQALAEARAMRLARRKTSQVHSHVAVFRTANLNIAPCTPADSEDFIALELDPDVMHFLNGGCRRSRSTDPDAVDFLMPRGTEPFVWTARLKDNGDFVGWFCLSSAGWKISRDWISTVQAPLGPRLCLGGRTRACGLGFAGAGYEMIEACTMAVNLGSRRGHGKLGMRHVRTVEVKSGLRPGADQGELWYEMSRAEWDLARQPCN